MTRIERDWLLDLAAADLLDDTQRAALAALLASDPSAAADLARRRALTATLAALPGAPAHDDAGLTRAVMAQVRAQPAWSLAAATAPTTPLPTAEVPAFDSAILRSGIREQLGEPGERVEYLAAGLAGGFLDETESAAAAARLASDATARAHYAAHARLDNLLGAWSAQADEAVRQADLSAVHAALRSETAPAPAPIPFAPPAAAPAARRQSATRRVGLFLVPLAAAAAVAGLWVNLRGTGTSANMVSPEIAVLLPSPSGVVPAEAPVQLAFAGPSLAPPVLPADAVLTVAAAPPSVAVLPESDDGYILPADDADARPRGVVSVAVDFVPNRAATAEEAVLLF